MIAEKDFAGRQSRGARELQEDAYAFSEIIGADGKNEGILVVVADGMGGHTAGEQASELALKNFIAAFHDAPGKINIRLKTGLTAANDGIAKQVQRDAAFEGMGTTLLAVAVTPAGLEWISVGDSPLYLLRNGRLEQLNEDHSLRPVLKEMVKQGEIPAEQTSSSKNILRAALIGDEISLVDLSRKALREGDLILVATDGIRTLNDETIQTTCAQGATTDTRTVATNLLHAIRQVNNPKQDNTTVAVISVPSKYVS